MGTDPKELKTGADAMSAAPGAVPGIPPFFIVGFQRSGTTLLRLMLDSHPQVAIPLDTTGLWSRFAARLGEFGPLERDENRRRLVEALLAEERIRLWDVPLEPGDVLAGWTRPGFAGAIEGFQLAYARAKGKEAWGDKDPGNMLRIGQVLTWFPDARVVHIVRDGRDACLSLVKQEFGGDDLLRCAEQWREQVWWVRQIGRLLGERRYFELRYEDLVEDPEGVLRPLAAFLGLGWSPAMLEYHRRVDEAVPPSKRHIWPLLDRPPQPSARFRWKSELTLGVRTCFEKRAGDVLRDMGYETLPGRPSGAYGTEIRFALQRIRAAVARRLQRG